MRQLPRGVGYNSRTKNEKANLWAMDSPVSVMRPTTVEGLLLGTIRSISTARNLRKLVT